MTEYQTVFTVLQKSAPTWLLVVVPIVVILCTMFGAVAFLKLKTRRVAVVVVYVVIVFIALTLSPSGVADMYSRARQAYLNGEYQVVEGTVSNFQPMPLAGHQNESFSVNGAQFSYSDYVVSPCFNNTTSHRGPIGEGLRVRIAYSGDCILKLEVARR